MSFPENRRSERHALFTIVNQIYFVFFTFFFRFVNNWMKDMYKNLSSYYEFHENWPNVSHIKGRKWIYIRAFHIYRPISVKFGTRDLDLMLLNICEFHENWLKRRPQFSYGRKWNYVNACTLKSYDISTASLLKLIFLNSDDVRTEYTGYARRQFLLKTKLNIHSF